jgi:WD40 repeat protein
MLFIKKKRTGWMIAMITLMHCSANTQELIMPVGHTEDIFSTHFLRSGQYVLTSAYDNTAKLWDTYSGRILQTFPKLAHSNNHIINSGITTLLSPDKKYMVAITVDGWLKKWSVPNGKLVFQKYILNTLGTHLKFSDDGNHLLVHNRYSNEETEGELINAHTGKTLIKIKKDKGNPFEGRSITLSPKGDSYLATSEKKIRLFLYPATGS